MHFRFKPFLLIFLKATAVAFPGSVAMIPRAAARCPVFRCLNLGRGTGRERLATRKSRRPLRARR